jgi:hypothetical protein
MAKSKQSKGAEELIPEGAPESEPQSEPEIVSVPATAHSITIPDEPKSDRPQTRATGAPQGVMHFEKLAASGGVELKFKTEEELAKYNADVRTINNMQVADPMRFQAERGYFPRRGDTSIEKRGLTPQDQEDVITAKKRLEGPDEQGNFKAVEL